ncbi:MAG TPA: hypothetical protein VG125_06065 [Pirellulales bacterium]|jgi:hypothetical protein|nr:hypothetical protein [Pirellulales bacterium]
MNRLIAEQRRRNRTRDDQWQLTESHRRHVTDRIVALAGCGDRRLCVLGAGNANDLDLPALAAAFREVHLVDIDGDALERGVARREASVPHVRAKIHLHPGVDVTGVWDALGGLPREATDATLAELAERAAQVICLPLPGPFDVAVSAGLVSQLIDGVVMSVPAMSTRFMQLVLSVRSGHLRLLARLVSPRGRGLLITDFVSSETAPELANTPDDRVGELAERLAAAGNFFHGLNPAFLTGLFQQDPVLRPLIARVNDRGHWIWTQRSRRYAVMAIEFERSQSSPGTASS